MKRKYFYRAIVILLIPVTYFLFITGFKGITASVEANSTPPPPVNKDFDIFILNNDYMNSHPSISVENQYDNYRSLYFTGIQIYENTGGGNGTVYGTARYGWFDTNLTQSQVTSIDSLTAQLSNRDLKLYWERTKLSRLLYAQRLVYEVSQGNNTVNYGFCYQDIMSGTYETDSGRTVLHASTIPSQPNSPGWLCKNIYENMQHGDHYGWTIQMTDGGIWHRKPMMRIRESDFGSADTRPVVAVVAKNFNGNTVDSVIIHVNNFRDKVNNNYYGQYIDDFTFLGGFDSLQIPGDTNTGINKGLNYSDWWDWENDCHVDFKVYWFGQVDVWFDKMTVDDEIANGLFNHIHDLKIQDEISNTSNLGFTYFIDEISQSMVPCIKYVDSVMKTVNPNAKLNCAFSNFVTMQGMKNQTIGNRMLMENTNLSSVSIDAHEINAAPVPDVFNSGDLDERIPVWLIKSTSEYTDFIQKRTFGDRNSRTERGEWFAGDNWLKPFYSILNP